jgi:hypothetical protein
VDPEEGFDEQQFENFTDLKKSDFQIKNCNIFIPRPP